MSKKGPVVPVSGEINWPWLTRKNEKSNKFQYDLCHLSEQAVKELEGTLGINVPWKEEKGFYLTLKSGYEFVANDAQGNNVTDKVGNGSRGKALVGSYTNSYGTWAKPVGNPLEIVITELVEYESSGSGSVDLNDVEPF